jgi:hypothetical protein
MARETMRVVETVREDGEMTGMMIFNSNRILV